MGPKKKDKKAKADEAPVEESGILIAAYLFLLLLTIFLLLL